MRRRVLAVTMLLAGVLGEVFAGESVSVRVSGLPSSSSSSPLDIAENRVLQEFRKRNPEVEIRSAQGLKIEGLSAEIGPLMLIASGNAPDIIEVNFRKIDSYVRQGFLYPLDDFAKVEQVAKPGWLSERVPPQVEPVIFRENAANERHLYAIPMRHAVMGLYYNKPLFRRAGLPMRVPADWVEMEEFAKKINSLGGQYKGLAVNSGQQASWNLMNFLWSSGGQAVVETAPNEWRAAFDSDEAVEAFMYYYRLTEGEHIAYRGDLSQMKAAGEYRFIGMQFGYIGDTLGMDPSVWGFGAVPTGPKGIRGAEINSRMLGIFSGVKDPRVRQAAWKFIAFVSSPEAQRIRVDTLIEMGLSNQVNPADLRRFGYHSLLRLAEDGLEEQFRIAMDTAQPEPYGKNCNLIYLEMTYPLDRILLSSKIAQAWHAGNQDEVREGMRAILQDAVELTNERMLGNIPDGVMAKRRGVTWVVLAMMLAGFVYVGISMVKAFSADAAGGGRARGVQKLYAWGLLLLPILLTLMWSYVPLVRGAGIALMDYQILLKSTFVGIDNFANVLFSVRFWQSVLSTIHYSFWMLSFGFVSPIVLAYLLHLVPREKMLFRTLYYLPSLLTGAAVFVLWKQFFGGNGLVNDVLAMVGISVSRSWTVDPNLAMLSCVIPAIWAGVGPGCLIYLAALKTIPEEQFEAAEIDGAGFLGKTVHIIYPGLKPLIIINFVGAVMGAFQTSQNILIMTGGGPNGATEVIGLRIFYEAFMFLQFGPATAMAWILGAMLIGFTLIQLRKLSRMEFRGGGR